MSYIESALPLNTLVQGSEAAPSEAQSGSSADFADAYGQAQASVQEQSQKAAVRANDQSANELKAVDPSFRKEPEHKPLDAKVHPQENAQEVTSDQSQEHDAQANAVAELDEVTGAKNIASQSLETQVQGEDISIANEQTEQLSDDILLSNDDFYQQIFAQLNVSAELKPVAKEVNQLLVGDYAHMPITPGPIMTLPVELESALAELTPKQLEQLNVLIQQQGQAQGVDAKLLTQLSQHLQAMIAQGDAKAAFPKASPEVLPQAMHLEQGEAIEQQMQSGDKKAFADVALGAVKAQGQHIGDVSATAKGELPVSAKSEAQAKVEAIAAAKAQTTEGAEAKLGERISTIASDIKGQVTDNAKTQTKVSSAEHLAAQLQQVQKDQASKSEAPANVFARSEKLESTQAQSINERLVSALGEQKITSNQGSVVSGAAVTKEQALHNINVGSDKVSQSTIDMQLEDVAEQLSQKEHASVGSKVQQLAQALVSQVLGQGQTTVSDAIETDFARWQQQHSVNQASAQSMSAVQKHSAPLDSALLQAINISKSDAAIALHQRVNMMLNMNNQEAHIRLDPPELGSMQVRVRSEGEQAHVNFVVQSQQAKDALEQSLPRLRELLAQQGLALGDTNVEQHSSGAGEQDEQSQFAGTQQGALDEEISNEESPSVMPGKNAQSEQGIDFYA
ncbi:flagellar hook-length control protein FliK [Pseudoalteromonas sp. SSDWG2]|uniref:flagellar hook-length control protein FliK n=1 Tax=Pseudoalteromonas sp. SSDWG2 TaxID=3139391 RepID=UPI003BA9B84A